MNGKSEVAKAEVGSTGKTFIKWCGLVSNTGIVKIKTWKFIPCRKKTYFEHLINVA